MDNLKFGNEGARQKERFKLPPMTGDYINACYLEIIALRTRDGHDGHPPRLHRATPEIPA
jgi:hypothetical protein